MATCLVTGGAGFLGSHLCEYLLERGNRVVCVDNLETGSLKNIEHLRGPEFQWVQTDITNYYEVDGPVDFIYHMASPASPIDYARLPLHTLKVGSHGTHHTLGVAKVKRARFLLASTSEVYGDPEIHPQPETYWGNVNPIGPRGVYDEAKRYAEALTMAYLRQQGLNTCIARIFNTYGPRMRPNDGRAIPTFLNQALSGKPITVFGDGSQTRSFCYVDDLIRGLVALCESDVHDPVNIGNPHEMTLLEMAETVRELTGTSSEIVFEALPVDDPKVRQPDITRARELLGWEPEIELRDGLEKTIEHARTWAGVEKRAPDDAAGRRGLRAVLSDGPGLRGQESRSDQQGDRRPQLQLSVPGRRRRDEPVRGRAAGVGHDPRPADPSRPRDRHRRVPNRVRARGIGAVRGGRGGRRGGRPGRHSARLGRPEPLLDWLTPGGRSSVGRAPGCGPGGRGFESRRSPSAWLLTPLLVFAQSGSGCAQNRIWAPRVTTRSGGRLK